MADQKISITFLENRSVDDHRKGTAAEERYEKGKTYGFTDPRSADRWVKRGYAEYADEASMQAAAGASSDVSLGLSDRDRVSPSSEGKTGSRAMDPSTTGRPTDGPAANATTRTAADDEADRLAAINIPADWETAHHQTKRKIARDISGNEPASTEDADAVIRAELARRDSLKA